MRFAPEIPRSLALASLNEGNLEAAREQGLKDPQLREIVADGGNAQAVDALLEAKLLGSPQTDTDFLTRAIRAGNAPAAAQLLQKLPEGSPASRQALKALNQDDLALPPELMHRAFAQADKPTIQSVLHGASPECGRQVRAWAAEQGQLQVERQAAERVPRKLLEPLVPITRIDTLLGVAARDGAQAGDALGLAVHYLLEHKGDWARRSIQAHDAVWIAAERGELAQLQKLKQEGVKLDADQWGTPRGKQAGNILLEMVEHAGAVGASLNNLAEGEDREGLATQRSKLLVGIRSLLEEGCKPEARDPLGRTPLHLAEGCGDTELSALLIQAGARQDAVCHPHRGSLTPAELGRRSSLADRLTR